MNDVGAPIHVGIYFRYQISALEFDTPVRCDKASHIGLTAHDSFAWTVWGLRIQASQLHSHACVQLPLFFPPYYQMPKNFLRLLQPTGAICSIDAQQPHSSALTFVYDYMHLWRASNILGCDCATEPVDMYLIHYMWQIGPIQAAYVLLADKACNNVLICSYKWSQLQS